jgi:uncharacterized membrane protein HdeD (DUF308 family)
VELFTALSHREMTNRGWAAVIGVLSVLAGIVVLAFPGISLVALAIVVSVWLVVLGVMEIILALQIRTAEAGGGSRPARAT